MELEPEQASEFEVNEHRAEWDANSANRPVTPGKNPNPHQVHPQKETHTPNYERLGTIRLTHQLKQKPTFFR